MSDINIRMGGTPVASVSPNSRSKHKRTVTRQEAMERVTRLIARNPEACEELFTSLASLAQAMSYRETLAHDEPTPNAPRLTVPVTPVISSTPLSQAAYETTIITHNNRPHSMFQLEINNNPQNGDATYTLKVGGLNIETASEPSVIRCLNSARRTADAYLEENHSTKRIGRWKPVELINVETSLQFQGELI